jgi:hypothetical protein
MQIDSPVFRESTNIDSPSLSGHVRYGSVAAHIVQHYLRLRHNGKLYGSNSPAESSLFPTDQSVAPEDFASFNCSTCLPNWLSCFQASHDAENELSSWQITQP